MKLGELFETSSRKAWRAWLARNHKKKKEIWLVYLRTHTGNKRVRTTTQSKKPCVTGG
jgi:hypothetical protein